jgi:hypothetical protein
MDADIAIARKVFFNIGRSYQKQMRAPFVAVLVTFQCFAGIFKRDSVILACCVICVDNLYRSLRAATQRHKQHSGIDN